MIFIVSNRTFHKSVTKCTCEYNPDKEWKFAIFLSNLHFVVSFNLPSPFPHSLPEANGRHKVLQRCKKSQVKQGLKLHGCLYEALIYPQRERQGDENKKGY